MKKRLCFQQHILLDKMLPKGLIALYDGYDLYNIEDKGDYLVYTFDGIVWMNIEIFELINHI